MRVLRLGVLSLLLATGVLLLGSSSALADPPAPPSGQPIKLLPPGEGVTCETVDAEGQAITADCQSFVTFSLSGTGDDQPDGSNGLDFPILCGGTPFYQNDYGYVWTLGGFATCSFPINHIGVVSYLYQWDGSAWQWVDGWDNGCNGPTASCYNLWQKTLSPGWWQVVNWDFYTCYFCTPQYGNDLNFASFEVN